MKVFITGATGLIGAHTTLELLRTGHSVRLLVRDRKKAEQYFKAHGFDVDDLVVTDMRDVVAIKQGLQGCDAVVHAAAVVGLERRRADEIYNSNVDAIHAVIGTACEVGIKNIIHVSSIGALFVDKKLHPEITTVDESTPLGSSAEAYGRSKLYCEKYVRDLQKKGAPIQVTYPTSVLGPDDPKLNESNKGLKIFVDLMLPMTNSGFQLVDVRDIGIAHRLMLEKGCPANPEQGRYILGGYYYDWPALGDLIDGVTGKKLLRLKLPDCVWMGIGAICDAIQHVIPFDFALTRESTTMITQWTPANSDKAKRELGLVFRNGEETIRDTLRWMAQAGHIKPKQAGKAFTTNA